MGTMIPVYLYVVNEFKNCLAFKTIEEYNLEVFITSNL